MDEQTTAPSSQELGLGMVGFFRSLVASSPTPETIRLHLQTERPKLALMA